MTLGHGARRRKVHEIPLAWRLRYPSRRRAVPAAPNPGNGESDLPVSDFTKNYNHPGGRTLELGHPGAKTFARAPATLMGAGPGPVVCNGEPVSLGPVMVIRVPTPESPPGPEPDRGQLVPALPLTSLMTLSQHSDSFLSWICPWLFSLSFSC